MKVLYFVKLLHWIFLNHEFIRVSVADHFEQCLASGFPSEYSLNSLDFQIMILNARENLL